MPHRHQDFFWYYLRTSRFPDRALHACQMWPEYLPYDRYWASQAAWESIRGCLFWERVDGLLHPWSAVVVATLECCYYYYLSFFVSVRIFLFLDFFYSLRFCFFVAFVLGLDFVSRLFVWCLMCLFLFWLYFCVRLHVRCLRSLPAIPYSNFTRPRTKSE